MNKAEIQTLFEYNAWATRQVLAAASQLTVEQFTAPAGLSFGSLRATLVHLLSAELVWRSRCQQGISLPALPGETAYPTLAALKAALAVEADGWAAYLASRSEADFSGLLEYTNTRGQPYATPLWQVLLHVVNHGTQFRSEAAVALTAFGSSPGDLDLILFLREKK